jgi:outer membrane protein assembly factor BamA
MIQCKFFSPAAGPGALRIWCVLFFAGLTAMPVLAQEDSAVAYKIIRKIDTEGNKITRRAILLRELPFKAGDTIPADIFPQMLERVKENLLNTSLFNIVNVYPKETEHNGVEILVSVTERWYVWPVPIFELVDRNFNEWWLTKNLKRTNYGFYMAWYNFRGRNETLRFIIQEGFTQKYSLLYGVPYLSRRQSGGMTWYVSFSRNREIAYKTSNNTLEYFRDSENFIRRELNFGMRYTVRKGIYNTTNLLAEYRINNISDTISYLNEDYFLGNQTRQKYFRITYFFKSDHRNIQAYPLKGYYYDFEVNKIGLALTNDDIDIVYITSTFKKYWQLDRRLYFATGLKGKLSGISQQPYFNQRALGYGGDYVRGYEHYVIDGQNFGLLKTNFKVELLPTRYKKFKFIPLEKFNTIHYAFYLNLYADAGYVRDNQYFRENPLLANALHYGGGIGLDYVTYYDRVFRFEYSINKFGERGFFLHFSAPI